MEEEGIEINMRTNLAAFKRFLEITRILRDEVKVLFDEDGMHVRAVGPAHVGMVHLDYNPLCISGNIPDDTEAVINVDKLHSYIRGITEHDPVPIDQREARIERIYPYKKKDTYRMVFKCAGITKHMMLEHPEEHSVAKVPKTPHLNAHFDHTAPHILRRVEAIASVADAVAIVCRHRDKKKGMLEISIERVRDDMDNVVMSSFSSLSDPECRSISCDVKEDVYSLFSFDYLQDMLFSLGDNKVQMHIGSDYPLRIDFDITHKMDTIEPTDNISGYFLLAPRMESE